jgi:hypothetical protein
LQTLYFRGIAVCKQASRQSKFRRPSIRGRLCRPLSTSAAARVDTGRRSAKPKSNGRIGEVIADGAIVDTLRGDGGTALQFEIHRAKLNGVTHNGSLTYSAQFHNPLPPGEIRSSGTFGPWNTDAPGQRPLAGRYMFQKADLSVFPGIGGTRSPEDDFRGALGHIERVGV